MDKKQLFKDIFTLNFTSFGTRYHKLVAVLKRALFLPSENYSTSKDIYAVPIIINNRNRLTYLKQVIEWYQKAGYRNIYVLDNQSNYEPLLNYYKEQKVKVIHLNDNYGHLAFWTSGTYKQFYTDYYVYTDPDVVPVEQCPPDFMNYFMGLLKKYSNIEKVGFGLKIDDLPEHYNKKQDVIAWEKKFWEKQVEPNVYDAALDTTFALYKPYTRGDLWVQNALRTGGNYVARHLPWYEDSAHVNAENKFYSDNAKPGASHWIK
jgi:hypothetical protein